jgi:hypothetical protein
MAKRSSVALVATGVVLVLAGGLVKWVAAPALVKVPLDVNTTTVAEGDIALFVPALQTVKQVPIVATRTVRGDKSAGTGSTAVYDETLCLVAQGTATDALGCAPATDPGFVEKSTDRIAFDRKTALPVSDGARFKANVDGNAAIVHQGLDYTFPIDTKKKSYPLFNTVIGKAYPIQYQGSEKLRGLTVYRFQQTLPVSPITIQKALPGNYVDITTVWVEPTTGVIVKGEDKVTEKITANGVAVFAGTLTFNDKTVGEQVSYAKSQLNKVHILRWWIPLAALVVGLLLVAGGLMLGRRRTAPTITSSDEAIESQSVQTRI